MKTKHDITREYYYKAKGGAMVSRGTDGLTDETYFKSIDGCPIALRQFIDMVRRVPEDAISMSDCADQRVMQDIGRSEIDYYAHNRECMAYRAFKLVDSKQCRDLV